LSATVAAVTLAALGVVQAETAHAVPPPPDPSLSLPAPPEDTTTVDPARRDATLQPGWRTSEDIAWTTSGDGAGFHVLVATARTGYSWRTVASLGEPGFDADQWIGNACLTGSGRRLVVVYAPRTFTNKADLFDRGGFTAVVDLQTGAVTKLPVLTSLAYFNPGCGTAETAVLTQLGGSRVDDPAHARLASRLFTVDTTTGKLSAPITLNTEVTSAVPVGRDIVAAGAKRLVRVEAGGTVRRLADTTGVPFRLAADRSGGLVFLDRDGDTVRAKRIAVQLGGKVTTLAQGPLLAASAVPGAGGRVFLTGAAIVTGKLPDGVQRLDVPIGAEVSSTGAVALTRVRFAGVGDPRAAKEAPGVPRGVLIDGKVLATGKALSFAVTPDTGGPAGVAGRTPHPKLLGSGGGARVNASPTNPVEDERTCSVPRNDPRNQALQPKPRQVEWAVDQAITGSLNLVREANWRNLGMPAYIPQSLFQPLPLVGGGRVPAQVMLGVLAQESNMWQAARFALPGVTANPLIGNFYGNNIYNADESDDWDIDWSKSDCGYGVAQVTDRMRWGTPDALPYETQRAVALDFAANVAAGLRILQEKWNETRRAGMIVNNGDPAKIENWFVAVWAYNSGFHPDMHDGQPWGVGWLNNPANPRYNQQRAPFLEDTYDDARTPQKWPYPEKVMGWAGHPIELNESPETLVAGYRAAWWVDVSSRRSAKPPIDLFCDRSNDCYPGSLIVPNDPEVIGEPAGPCGHENDAGLFDLKCWYHQPVRWKGDATSCAACGNEVLRFDPGYEYQADGTSFPPKCDTGGLPAGARIVDDIPTSMPSIRPNCPKSFTSTGAFGFTFASDASGHYPSKMDLHQIGGGFMAHMWRSHTRQPGTYGGTLKITGTWRPNPITGWTRIMVSVPDHGAWTRQADYTIQLGNGTVRHRVVNQAWRQHRWVELGVFYLEGNASVSLTNETSDGDGDESVIFDAMAFVPTVQPIASYVALGDSYSSGEGVEPYLTNSDYHRDDIGTNGCHRSQAGAYPNRVQLPGHSATIAQEAASNGPASFAFIACSGATTTAITRDAVNYPPSADDLARHTDWGFASQRWGEVAQVDQGYLDQDTTLVTVSAGGNDVRFVEVLRGCIIVNPVGGCQAAGHRLTRDNGVVDPDELRRYEAKLIEHDLPAHLTATYRAIHSKAPNAKIIVVGYPQLFEDVPLSGCYGITPSTMDFLNKLASMLTSTIAKAVAEVRASGVNIQFIDPTPRWRTGVGSNTHWACPSQDASWTNAVINFSDSGSGRNVPGTGSFHPKRSGQDQLGDLVNIGLRPSSSAQAIADRITAYVATRSGDRWTITSAQARYAAERCLLLTARAGLVGDPCMTTPILLPSASDAAGAADNDDAAINGQPAWVRLTRVSDTEKRKVLNRGWFDTGGIQTICPTPRPANMQCDEYPFYASSLGGVWDWQRGQNAPTSTRLALIPATENGNEGRMLGAMYTACGMATGTYLPPNITAIGSPFLTIPLVDRANAPNQTMYIC
jgi:hypothetical protein